ncbi:YfhO family protein [Staphylococcus sp. 18_1_E_LY]|uniref:YfhO family protein n=1 Tax=Staphylococcus lloydii TaxID=2781774 RepID=A0A7T1AYK2_9STAP|nr:YfhO family protein [Staphylococcus lloydii]MBF7018878.1 YfhO family protein [Staphylococcus lloydii]MBF7026606.1 YfhO family protein [Staphylococcus lloydii]QPM74271.1 YfhO family protein [Staphylococcus lloydii]
MLNRLWSNKITRFICILLMGIIVAMLIFTPYIIRFFKDGIIFSGSGDGVRQMIPFQMYLYHHFIHFDSFYDHSFGLGGDYIKDLSYYYATSPFTYINFIAIWICSQLFHLQPNSIMFWPGNQLIVAFVKTVVTFMLAFYYFNYLHFKKSATFIAALLYGGSTIVIYFNFTWSFYGDLLIFLPLSLLGMERYFKEKKLRLFIFAVALTLFSNFYFSYFEALVLFGYFIYRVIWKHEADIVTRKQKIVTLIIAALLSLMSAIWGFYTGVSSFLANNRKPNPDFHIPAVTDFARQTHFFSNGFFITVTIFALVALLSFQLYRHYYYRLFAIFTWIMLLGSLTPYFDSLFNGFSTPERRWIYVFALTTGALIGLFIHYLKDITLRAYLMACTPVVIAIIIANILIQHEKLTWMYICLLIMMTLGLIIARKHLLDKRWPLAIVIVLFMVQQAILVNDHRYNNLRKYETTFSQLKSPNYHNATLAKSINKINESHQDDPFNRIEFMTPFSLNTPLIYHFNGIILYSSIFDGSILNYYDKTMQINMPSDTNSTYRMLSNRANLMALWNVQDRIKKSNDPNLPYGFKHTKTIKPTKQTQYVHSKNTIAYPSAHITNKVYNARDLKIPLDREQAMLQGVTLSDKEKANTKFKPNKNLLSSAQASYINAHKANNNSLIVTKNNGGIQYKLPPKLAHKYKDMYISMDLVLRAPDKRHKISVNEYAQNRNELTYKYRRVVKPITIRVKANDKLNLKLSKGKYNYKIHGIYGEDYKTLRASAKSLTKIKVSQQRNGYTLTNNKQRKGYIVLPIPFRDGMKATANGKTVPVMKGNGIMTVVHAKHGEQQIKLTYHPPLLWPLICISIVGIVLSVLFARWIKHH